MASTDPLLAPNPHRFVLFPIKYQQVWEMYKKHEVTLRAPPSSAAPPRPILCRGAQPVTARPAG
jgi:hypothetical protein